MKMYRALLAAGLLLAAASAPGEAGDSAWTLRFHGAIIDSSAESSIGSGETVTGSVEAGGGIGIGAEYRTSRRIGVEVSALFAGLVIGNGIAVGEVISDLELSMVPLTLAVPVHIGDGGRIDLYVAPTFSVIRYLDLEARIGNGHVEAGVDVDTDTAVGANVGLDIPFGKGHWAFSSSVRFMKTAFQDTDLDPVIVTVGFAYRF